MQTHNNLALISNALSPKVGSVCVYGGVPKPEQIRILRNERPRIVVGTPGRLLDLAREGNLDLGNVSWLVLDEADRMLDKGFENDIREIIKLCLPSPSSALGPIKEEQGEPKFRRTAMFSATWPMSVRKLAADFMTQPLRITVGSDSLQANARVEQVAIVVEDQRKKETLLLTHLRDNGFSLNSNKKTGAQGKDREKVLVFALYKKEATRLHEFLKNKGYEVVCINGDMTQEKRTKSLEDFKEGRANILVATGASRSDLARLLLSPLADALSLFASQTSPLAVSTSPRSSSSSTRRSRSRSRTCVPPLVVVVVALAFLDISADTLTLFTLSLAVHPPHRSHRSCRPHGQVDHLFRRAGQGARRPLHPRPARLERRHPARPRPVGLEYQKG